MKGGIGTSGCRDQETWGLKVSNIFTAPQLIRDRAGLELKPSPSLLNPSTPRCFLDPHSYGDHALWSASESYGLHLLSRHDYGLFHAYSRLSAALKAPLPLSFPIIWAFYYLWTLYSFKIICACIYLPQDNVCSCREGTMRPHSSHTSWAQSLTKYTLNVKWLDASLNSNPDTGKKQESL